MSVSFQFQFLYLCLAIQGAGAGVDLTDRVSVDRPHGPKNFLEPGHQLRFLCQTHLLQLLWQHLREGEEEEGVGPKASSVKTTDNRTRENARTYCTLSNSYLKGKEGLDTVGSVQTVQAVGPDGPALSPKKTLKC